MQLGLLPAVGSLTATPIPLDSFISLTWTPPFSLDIPDIDPDITYCVGVVNLTFSLVIHSQCDIEDIHYNYTVSPRSTPCDNYTFTVNPVNIVGNGTSASVTLLSSITEGEIAITLLFKVIMTHLLLYIAPPQVESEDLKDVVMMDDSILFYFEEVSLILCIIIIHNSN